MKETSAPSASISAPSSRARWIILAIASGTFAALNGLFAKLYVIFEALHYNILHSIVKRFIIYSMPIQC